MCKWMIVFLAWLWAPCVWAEEVTIRKLAVVSAMADTLTLVLHRPQVGSHLDRNTHEVLDIPDGSLDAHANQVAQQAARKALAAAPPTNQPTAAAAAATVVVVPFNDKQAGVSWFADGRFSPPASWAERLQQSGASHLLLMRRHRSEASLKLAAASTGSGHLEGFGFYIDKEFKVRRHDTRELGVGFLAPYAYFQVQLVDLASGQTVSEKTVHASSTVSSARNENGLDAWGALSAEQKVRALQRMTSVELTRVIPELLKPK